jgi:GNAT superfamily N-acetyltransferase
MEPNANEPNHDGSGADAHDNCGEGSEHRMETRQSCSHRQLHVAESSSSVGAAFVENLADLEAIKAIQTENLKRNISSEESANQGYVTAEYTIEFLQELHSLQPTVVGRELATSEVCGYAIAVHPAIRGKHALLDALFDDIDTVSYDGRDLRDAKYILCGQLCVKKGYRGQGLSTKMYEYFRAMLSNSYDSLITEVPTNNVPSLKAHEKLGFRCVKTTEFNGVEFQIILWDWRQFRN